MSEAGKSQLGQVADRHGQVADPGNRPCRGGCCGCGSGDVQEEAQNPSYEGAAYAVLSFVPASPILLRCPWCDRTDVSVLVRRPVGLCGLRRAYLHECGFCGQAVAEVDDDQYVAPEDEKAAQFMREVQDVKVKGMTPTEAEIKRKKKEKR